MFNKEHYVFDRKHRHLNAWFLSDHCSATIPFFIKGFRPMRHNLCSLFLTSLSLASLLLVTNAHITFRPIPRLRNATTEQNTTNKTKPTSKKPQWFPLRTSKLPRVLLSVTQSLLGIPFLLVRPFAVRQCSPATHKLWTDNSRARGFRNGLVMRTGTSSTSTGVTMTRRISAQMAKILQTQKTPKTTSRYHQQNTKRICGSSFLSSKRQTRFLSGETRLLYPPAQRVELRGMPPLTTT